MRFKQFLRQLLKQEPRVDIPGIPTVNAGATKMDERPSESANETNMATPDSKLLKLPVETIMMILHSIQDKISMLVPVQPVATPWLDDPYLKHICSLQDAELAEYEQILWRNRLCAECKELRRDAASYEQAVRRIYQTILCSGCETCHPLYLFSYGERQKACIVRNCIGRQGYVRHCKHITYNFHSLKDRKLVRSESLLDRNRQVRWVDTPDTPPFAQLIRNVPKYLAEFMDLNPSMNTYPCHHAGTSNFHLRRASLMGNWASVGNFAEHVAQSTCTSPNCGFSTILQVGKNSFDIQTDHKISLTSATDPSWLCALDPQTYLDESNELGRGLMWCRTPSCATMRLGRTRDNLFCQQSAPSKGEYTPRCYLCYSRTITQLPHTDCQMDQHLRTNAENTAPNNMLLELPDETIMNILHSTNRISFLMLRQACSKLRRLCEDATFEHRLPISWRTEPLQVPGGRQPHLRGCVVQWLQGIPPGITWQDVADCKKKDPYTPYPPSSCRHGVKVCRACSTRHSRPAESPPHARGFASADYARSLSKRSKDQEVCIKRCFEVKSNEAIRDASGWIAEVLSLEHPLTHCNHASNWNTLSRLPVFHGPHSCIMPQCKLKTTISTNDFLLSITSRHAISVKYPVDPAWLDALDPESYLSERDKLTRGLMWCRNPGCPITRLGDARHFLFHQQVSGGRGRCLRLREPTVVIRGGKSMLWWFDSDEDLSI
ncbi:hypothetical protein PG994_008981 [Apiospora phragmitis]|uniref:F-box domain-containing protein n=1 Tax=Apiospora phragmitis TaxID=2905665 RepID=A0ABR1UKW2_9PEZI